MGCNSNCKFAIGPGCVPDCFDAASDPRYALAVKSFSGIVLLILIAASASGQTPANPNQRNANGERPLVEAVAAGQLNAAAALLAAGADPNLPSASGRTALIEAALRGRIDMVRLLIAAGADLNISERGAGTALEAAEREGHVELAALLRRSGARTSGRSVGDKVCVRPWKGDGYCGLVEAIDHNDYQVRVTEIVGCAGGCAMMPDCSAGKRVGGADGLQRGVTVTVPSSCLTHTGVPK